MATFPIQEEPDFRGVRFPDIRSAADWLRENTNLLAFSSETQFIAVGYWFGSEALFVLRHEPHDGPCADCHRWEQACRQD